MIWRFGNPRPFPGRRLQAGFSLIEMLVVIGLIGILAGIVIPAIVGITQEAAEPAKDRRNAQTLASICAAAQVANVEFVVPGDLAATIDNIVSGGVSTTGSFAGNTFGLPGLFPSARSSAMQYLEIQDGTLLYKRDP